MDGILAVAARLSRERRRSLEPSQSAFLDANAFRFLSDLQNNSNSEWMNDNRTRYRSSLAEPFRSLLQTVAEKFIADLDPELNTAIKTNQVLASIRKRFPDESGEYHPYYWGAFSRRRKQEDAQLYVIIKPHQLEAGVGFGSAADDQQERVRKSAKSQAPRLWSAIASAATGESSGITSTEQVALRVIRRAKRASSSASPARP